jgi:ubiquinone biosynthesis accessory factor UbiK
MNNSDFFQKFQSMAEEVQKKVTDAVKDSPAKDLEKNVRGLMNQGFQKMDLITRQEFDIQVQVLAKTREKLEALEAKLAAIEEKLNPINKDENPS